MILTAQTRVSKTKGISIHRDGGGYKVARFNWNDGDTEFVNMPKGDYRKCMHYVGAGYAAKTD